LQTVTGTGALGDQGLIEMLQDNFMNWTQKIKILVAFRSAKYKYLLAISVLIKEQMSLKFKILIGFLK